MSFQRAAAIVSMFVLQPCLVAAFAADQPADPPPKPAAEIEHKTVEGKPGDPAAFDVGQLPKSVVEWTAKQYPGFTIHAGGPLKDKNGSTQGWFLVLRQGETEKKIALKAHPYKTWQEVPATFSGP